MKRPKLTMIATTLMLASGVIAATTPCGWPRTPTIGGGGVCTDPVFGGPSCSQATVQVDGGCPGGNNPKTCGVFTHAKDYTYWVPTDPNTCDYGCTASASQVNRLTYHVGVQGNESCILISND